MVLDDVVFCSGFWSVSDNKKRDIEHYKKLLPETMEMLSGGCLVFFYEDEWVRLDVERLAEKFCVTAELIYMPLENLPMRGRAAEFVELAKSTSLPEIEKIAGNKARKEKGLKHYHRELKESGELVYKDLLSIWFSKVFLVEQVSASSKYFAHEKFAWVDASIARFSRQRKHWDFTGFLFSQHDRLYHYPSKLRFWGRPLPLNASFMLGSREVWENICLNFIKVLGELKEVPYPHDEETVLGLIWYRKRHLFFSMDEFGYRKVRLETYRLYQKIFKGAPV